MAWSVVCNIPVTAACVVASAAVVCVVASVEVTVVCVVASVVVAVVSIVVVALVVGLVGGASLHKCKLMSGREEQFWTSLASM